MKVLSYKFNNWKLSGMVWFRVFGVGLLIVDHRISRPYFSERYGFDRRLHLGPYCFKFLRREV